MALYSYYSMTKTIETIVHVQCTWLHEHLVFLLSYYVEGEKSALRFSYLRELFFKESIYAHTES